VRKNIIFIFIVLICSGLAQAEEPFIYDDKEKRDPLWSLVSPSGTIINYETDLLIGDLNLEGIVYGANGKSLAIINGRILNQGEAIGQFIISEVTANSVILTKGSQRFELKLKKEE